MSQPSETSSPAVRQRPWTRASVGNRQRLEPPHGAEQRRRSCRSERSPPASTICWKHVDVGAAREQLALGAPDERPGVGALDLVEAVVERLEGRVAEQVQRRVVEDHRGDGAVALQANRGALTGSPP